MADRYMQPVPTAIWRKDRQVTIQRFNKLGADVRGQPIGEWVGVMTPTVWASVEPLNARTAEYARALYSEATHRVFIDYRADVTNACRLLYGSRVLHIGAVINRNEANVTLELLCTEGDA
ncbi:MAG: phage head closure protein [Planctomycetaceae bacterium]|nr:phage head closure protein [Planctomycetaceae bacterium]